MTRMVLDEVCDNIQATPEALGGALDALSLHLRTWKRGLSTRQWRHTVATCRAHPLCELLHQDPLTARAFARSRGYQGDAGLLDIIYASDYRQFVFTPVTPLGGFHL